MWLTSDILARISGTLSPTEETAKLAIDMLLKTFKVIVH